MARLLVEKGYREVLPLMGGFDGWVELGYPTESANAAAANLPPVSASSPAKQGA